MDLWIAAVEYRAEDEGQLCGCETSKCSASQRNNVLRPPSLHLGVAANPETENVSTSTVTSQIETQTQTEHTAKLSSKLK